MCYKNTQTFITTTIGSGTPARTPSFLPHLPVGGQMLDGHLAGFGSGQPDFGLSAGLRLLPQDVLVGEDVPIHSVPEDQLARVGTAGEEPV